MFALVWLRRLVRYLTELMKHLITTHFAWTLRDAVAESSARSAACADSAVGGVAVAGNLVSEGGVGCFRGSNVDVVGCIVSGRCNQKFMFQSQLIKYYNAPIDGVQTNRISRRST